MSNIFIIIIKSYNNKCIKSESVGDVNIDEVLK